MITELKPPKPKSRSDIIKTLRELLELAQRERIEYIDIAYKTERSNEPNTRVHIDGAFHSEWMYRD